MSLDLKQDILNAIIESKLIGKANSIGIMGKWEGTPVIEIDYLISWLNDQKYINVDETSDNMTEEFERKHQWELSRNCFINKMIRKLKEVNNI